MSWEVEIWLTQMFRKCTHYAFLLNSIKHPASLEEIVLFFSLQWLLSTHHCNFLLTNWSVRPFPQITDKLFLKVTSIHSHITDCSLLTFGHMVGLPLPWKWSLRHQEERHLQFFFFSTWRIWVDNVLSCRNLGIIFMVSVFIPWENNSNFLLTHLQYLHHATDSDGNCKIIQQVFNELFFLLLFWEFTRHIKREKEDIKMNKTWFCLPGAYNLGEWNSVMRRPVKPQGRHVLFLKKF